MSTIPRVVYIHTHTAYVTHIMTLHKHLCNIYIYVCKVALQKHYAAASVPI